MDILFLGVWLGLFFARSDYRREMLILSILCGIGGPVTEYFYIKDWWHPLTVTGTLIGFEDVFYAFVSGGISAVIYKFVARKVNSKPGIKLRKVLKERRFQVTVLVGTICFIGGYFVFHINTFLLSMGTQAVILFYIFVLNKRIDLIKPALFTGLLTVVGASFVYTMMNFLTPGWIEEFWYFKNVPHIILLNVPIDDICWYFLVGGSLGIYYEFWTQTKIESHS